MAAAYKLRGNLVGHKKDVRSVSASIVPEGGIVSGSRDGTARVWLPNDNNAGFIEGQILQGHSSFVATVCVLPPDDTYPNGLIATGSNDHTILMFTPGQLDPLCKLAGHTDTVCALAAGKFGFLLSGSWDKTAKVWLNQKCVMTLEGHEMAVWAVAVMSEKGVMLTGSADKTIKLWKAGRCEITFKGHTDCVRGLMVIESGMFLSCANDCTVRKWAISGDCLAVFTGHSNYVYSIALLPNGQDFVTSGEDRTMRVWRDGQCVQTISHPTQSVWCVCTLPNGDIVTGASDGVVRVFTAVPERMAPSDQQKAFEELVASSGIASQVGDINKEDLPGPEALFNPGHRDGQTKLIRDEDRVEAYNWDATKNEWTKVGEVVGATGGSQATSGKVLYEGKEYDYVFDVDIEDGKPSLKLPYNKTEDPWLAAQKFLDKNSLSQLFLDQVANFITTNAKGIEAAPQPSEYFDPFTGGSRYVPGRNGAAGGDVRGSDPFTGGARYQPEASTVSRVAPSVGADPFTGSGSYRPGGGSSAVRSSGYYPVTNFLTFDTADVKKIIAKVKEFNGIMEPHLHVSEESLDRLEHIISGQAGSPELEILQHLLQWPADKIFPVLDILRMGVKHPSVCHHFCQQPSFLNDICRHLTTKTSSANQMLALRTLTNLFSHEDGVKCLLADWSRLLQSIQQCENASMKNAQLALSTTLLNFSIAAAMAKDFELKSECLVTTAKILQKELDAEAAFRLLVALGTLIHDDESCQAVMHSLDLSPVLRNLRSKSDSNKVLECADHLLKYVS